MSLTRSPTWRIQSVPNSFTSETLRTAIEESCSGIDHDLRVVQISLARDDAQYSTATVTFNNFPQEWAEKAAGSFSIVTIEHESAIVYYDKDFDGFTPLYTPPKGVECTADIIAVPGLTGHALGSWKCTGDSSVWLRDFLPRSIPSAHIWVYGYDTKLEQNVRKDTLRDLSRTFYGDLKALHQQYRYDAGLGRIDELLLITQNVGRPLILLGHSLGALIVKESVTLAWADLSPAGLRLFRRVFAMMTFGAPNLGLRNGGLVSVVKGQLNEELVRSLVVTTESEPTELLMVLNDHFLRTTRIQRIELMLCYERETSPLVEVAENGKLVKSDRRALLVTEHSATFVGRHTEDHEQRAIARDHSQMVKYRTPHDKDYRFIASVLTTWVHEASAVIAARVGQQGLSKPDIKTLLEDGSVQSRLTPISQRTSEGGRFTVPTSQLALPPVHMSQESPSIRASLRKEAISSLASEGMFFGKDNFKAAASNTCTCLADNDKFNEWIHDRSKLLWVSGDPGAGKSVLMDLAGLFAPGQIAEAY